jgi:hypothetical protein
MEQHYRPTAACLEVADRPLVDRGAQFAEHAIDSTPSYWRLA